MRTVKLIKRCYKRLVYLRITSLFREEREEWRKRLIVKDPLMRFHRLLWETEDSNYANQLDKLAGILKDRPIKYSLAKRPAPNIPPLAVVRDVILAHTS